jgi:hypothetical protein
MLADQLRHRIEGMGYELLDGKKDGKKEGTKIIRKI